MTPIRCHRWKTPLWLTSTESSAPPPFEARHRGLGSLRRRQTASYRPPLWLTPNGSSAPPPIEARHRGLGSLRRRLIASYRPPLWLTPISEDSGDGLRQLPKAPREELAKKKFFTGVFYSSYMRFSEPEMEAFLLGSSRMSSIPSEDDRVFTPACRLLGIHQLPELWPRVKDEHLVIFVGFIQLLVTAGLRVEDGSLYGGLAPKTAKASGSALPRLEDTHPECAICG